MRAAAARRGWDADVAKMIAVLRRNSPESAALRDTRDGAVRHMDRKRIIIPTSASSNSTAPVASARTDASV